MVKLSTRNVFRVRVLTWKEFRIANIYWNATVSSVTEKIPNIQPIPSRGPRTARFQKDVLRQTMGLLLSEQMVRIDTAGGRIPRRRSCEPLLSRNAVCCINMSNKKKKKKKIIMQTEPFVAEPNRTTFVTVN